MFLVSLRSRKLQKVADPDVYKLTHEARRRYQPSTMDEVTVSRFITFTSLKLLDIVREFWSDGALDAMRKYNKNIFMYGSFFDLQV